MAFLRRFVSLLLIATVLMGSTSAQTDCSALLDLCFLVDISGSICDNDPTFDTKRDVTCSNWNNVTKFIETFVQNLDIGPSADHAALVTFGSTPSLIWDLNRYTDISSLQQAIRNLNYIKGQETDTAGGLTLMKNHVFNAARSNAEKVAIIITDGKPTNFQAATQAATDVQNSNIACYVVGVTNSIDETTLRYLSSNPKQENVTYFKAPTFAELNVILNRINYRICSTTPPPAPSIGAPGPTEATGATACASNCLSCNISLAYKCDICQPGYGLTPNRTCAPCASNCVSCNISNQCNNCQQGYGLTTPNRTCAPCSSNCAIGCNMTGAYKCDRCDSGYGLTVNGSCKECSPNCAIGCRNTGAYKCDRCDPGSGMTANGTCQACSLHCAIGCNSTGAYRCDQCDTGYGLTALNGSCKECSLNCAIGCKNTGAYKCDRCDPGYGLTGNGTCEAVLTTHVSSGTAESSGNPGITSSFVYFWVSTTTTWTTPVTGLPGGDITCPILEVGLGLGVPCGFIIIVLLIVITVMCVQNRSLREYKRQSEDSRQSHTILYSTASNATLQPPLTQYQHLKTENTQREYEGIDRYDTISTTETETTGHYETPLN